MEAINDHQARMVSWPWSSLVVGDEGCFGPMLIPLTILNLLCRVIVQLYHFQIYICSICHFHEVC